MKKDRAPDGVTQLLSAWSQGDPTALEKLIPLVESELHRLALRYLRGERPGHTLQATALVNEAYLRLAGIKGDWQSRACFFAAASTIMRHILVDHARRRRRRQQLTDPLLVSVVDAAQPGQESTVDVIALDQALEKLAEFDARKSRIVELRFFGGLSEEETAQVVGAPLRTIQREWSLARAWLFCQLDSPTPAR
jgi:RNA polymerase sigma factor (TIGR02999 family)